MEGRRVSNMSESNERVEWHTQIRTFRIFERESNGTFSALLRGISKGFSDFLPVETRCGFGPRYGF